MKNPPHPGRFIFDECIKPLGLTIEGLSQPELFVLAEIAGSLFLPDSGVALYHVKNAVERVGLTALGFSLGTRRLQSKGFIELREEYNHEGDPYQAGFLMVQGLGLDRGE